MSPLRICVYAICKNEAPFVDRWMDSMGEADLVVVTDTGSEDNTVKLLQKRGALVYRAEVLPWRFDQARNLSLDHVPEDVDVCVCTDLDEVFQPGWRSKLEAAFQTHVPAAPGPFARTGRYLYNWSLKPDGSPEVQFNYFKVHDRKGFRWQYPVHETLWYHGSLPLETIYIPGMVLNHYPDPQKSRSSYLPLLELGVKENLTDPRMRYYLGREYFYQQEWLRCVETLREYLSLPGAVWNEERCAAMRWMAKAFYKLQRIAEAYCWYYRAIAEAPRLREPYVDFQFLCYQLSDWAGALFLGETALAISQKSSTYVNMGYAWDSTPNDLCAVASYRMGLRKRALSHAEQALSLSPENPRLKKNLRLIQEEINRGT